MGYTQGKRWTTEEEAMILSGTMTMREIAALTGRRPESVYNKRCMMQIRSVKKPGKKPWEGSNSIKHHFHDGPEGWTPDMRAPCRVCGYHEAKTVTLDDGREKLRDECSHCAARQVWDRHEGGGVPTVAECDNYDYSDTAISDYM